MKHVLLINTSFPRTKREYAAFGAPLGILAIASALSEAGYETTFIDPQIEPNYLEKIDAALASQPLFVAMSTYFGCNLKNATEFSSRVKEQSPGTPVVWGGPIASSLPEVCLAQAQVDYIVMGPGESIIVELAESISTNALGPIHAHPNISCLIDGVLKRGSNFLFTGDLDELPRIDLSMWKEGIKRLGFIPLITSRGCPRRCSFCYNTFTAKGSYMLRSAESVVEEMHHWHEVTQCSTFGFIDDNFLINEDRAIAIISEAQKNNWKIIRLYGHLTDFHPRIRKIICEQRIPTTMCIESGSQRIRKILRKGVNIERALSLIEEFTSAGVHFTTAFMFGIPTEEDIDIRQSIEVADKVRMVSEERARSNYYLYAPQSGDEIITMNNYREKIDFSLDALANVEVVPVPPDDVIDLRLRPWMDGVSAAFYRQLALTWLYYFTPDFRMRHPDYSPADSFAENPRLKRLFDGILTPQEVTEKKLLSSFLSDLNSNTISRIEFENHYGALVSIDSSRLVTEVTKFYETTPDGRDAFSRLGLLYLANGDAEKAMELFKRDATLDRQGWWMRLRHAEAIYLGGNRDEGVQAVADVYADEAKAVNGFSEIAFHLTDAEEAEELYQRDIGLNRMSVGFRSNYEAFLLTKAIGPNS